MENRRKNYFIKKEFQAEFILKFCALVLLTAIISAALIYLFLSHSVTTVFENSRIIIKQSTDFIMPGLILSSLVSVILVSLATIIIVLFISHRIAGPLYKVENSLEKMGKGDVSFDIYFRKGDEAKILSEVFNKSRQNLNGMIGDIKKEFRLLTKEVEEVKKISGKLPPEFKEIKKDMDTLEISSRSIDAKINKFKL